MVSKLYNLSNHFKGFENFVLFGTVCFVSFHIFFLIFLFVSSPYFNLNTQSLGLLRFLSLVWAEIQLQND